jgi:hypothetical protein
MSPVVQLLFYEIKREREKCSQTIGKVCGRDEMPGVTPMSRPTFRSKSSESNDFRNDQINESMIEKRRLI